MKSSLPVLLALLLFTSLLFSQTIEWQKLDGPFGGTALSFVSFPNGDIFAGSGLVDKGIYFSSNNGATWQQKNNGIVLDRSIDCIVIADSGHLVASANSSNGDRMYKSTDHGESWFQIAALAGRCFAINSLGHIYAGFTASQTMHISTDNGNSWSAYSVPVNIEDIAINDSDHIFIAGATSWRSTDNGVNWTQLNTATSGLPSYIGSIAINSERHLFAGCLNNDSRMGVYKSTNNGDNWTKVKSDILVQSHGNIVIKNNGDIFVGSFGQGVWKSTDNGTTWTQHNAGLHHFKVRSMHITNNEIILAGLEGGGIYKSTDDGENWEQVGISVGQVIKQAISPVNGNIFAAVLRGSNSSLYTGMSRSTDSGQSWQPINNGLTNTRVTSIAIKNDGVIFIGGGSSTVHRSIDDGTTWVKADTGIQTHINPIEAMTVDTDVNIYAANYYGVHKSTNNGSSWVNIGGVANAKTLAFNSSGDLFLASWGQGLHKLPAGDTVWVNLTSKIGASWIYTLFIDSNDFIYADGKRSEDNGETWIQMGSTGHGASSYAENSQGHLFCGTMNFGSGAFRSTNNGDTWEAINNGLPPTSGGSIDIRSIAMDSEDYLYAGTQLHSMYKTTTSTITSVEEGRYTPASFSLKQNYPNPFNPSTVISYQLPVSGSVTLKVYDLLGREVVTLVDEYKPAGRYEVVFRPESPIGAGSIKHPASGVYFYQLVAGEYVNTKKMILLK